MHVDDVRVIGRNELANSRQRRILKRPFAREFLGSIRWDCRQKLVVLAVREGVRELSGRCAPGHGIRIEYEPDA